MKLLNLSSQFTAIFLLCLLVAGAPSAKAQIIYTFAGTGLPGFTGDGGAATAADLNIPWGVAVDGSGNVFIADDANNRIRKVNASGVISTIAGNGTHGYGGDGGAATAAEFGSPIGVCVDGTGNVYIADFFNSRIRKINTSGVISTFAGTGTPGYSGDGGAATAAEIADPYGVAVDRSGNVYIADYDNNRIRKVNTSGNISTIAGDGFGGYSGDGGIATAAEIYYPRGVAVDSSGNVYIADYENNRVRKVDTSGIITTFAGTGATGYSGDGGVATAAELSAPSGVALDASGNVYIADEGNNRIRIVNTSGIIGTFAGDGAGGYSGDGGAATAAELNFPSNTAADPSGRVYIADENNYRIRVVNPLSYTPLFAGGSPQGLTVCENSGADSINALLTITDPGVTLTETFSVTSAPAHGAVTTGGTVTSGTLVSPTGWAYTPATGYSGTDAFTIQVSNGTHTAITVIDVTVNPLPVAGTITGNDSVCFEGTDTLSASVAGGVWTSYNTSIATVNSVGVVTGGGMGIIDTIYYTVTNSCGAAVANYVVFVKDCEGAVIPVNNPERAMKLFPDPNTGAFTLNLSSQYDEDVQVVILNAVGEKMKAFITTTNKETPVYINAAAGIYIVQARTVQGVYTARLTIQ